MSSFSYFIQGFLPHKMRHEIKELYLSTLLFNFGVMMILIFEPIYLYTLGYSLQQIILYFLIVYLLYFFIMPFGASFARRFGYEHSIFVSTFINVGYYITFYFIADISWFFYLAPILYALQKTFYWPAFHADFARFSVESEDGREVSGMNVVVSLVSVVAPFAAGAILALWGFGALFAMASLLFIVSNIPLLITREIFVPKSFPYLETYRQLFSKENRRNLLSYLGFGEELVGMVIWPVFMAIVVVDLFNVGAITALATLITMLVTMYVGRSSDTGDKRRIVRFGAIFNSLSWFIRLFIRGVWGIFFVDTLGRLSKNITVVPLMALTYERAKKKSIMQSIVLFESSLVLGKLAALFILYAVLFFVPESVAFQAAFIVGGLMTLFFMLL